VEIRVLGAHKLESRDTRHTCFLIDGALAIDAGSLATALSPAEQCGIRAMLLTHRHFDHTRDLPTIALGTLHDPRHIDVYGLPATLDAVRNHYLNWDMYPDFTEPLGELPAKYRLHPVGEEEAFEVQGYQVRSFPMPHPAPTVAFLLSDAAGACVAYTGDTKGQLLPLFQAQPAVQLLFAEVSFPTDQRELAELTGHLTPGMLGDQLRAALDAGLPVPRVVVVHRDPHRDDEILAELESLATELGVELEAGHKDQTFTL
jgi:ribonuclease BN (tRNA processing enzyme)